MTDRHWRSVLTVFAWLLILQSILGLVSSVLGLLLQGLFVSGNIGPGLAGAEELVPGYEALPGLVGLLAVMLWAGLAFNGALLVGGFGLLRRGKWGWYTVVVVHILAAGGLFVLLPTAFGGILAMFAPNASPLMPWLLALLAALPALAVVGFLLFGPVVRQFERPAAPAG
jgi:hypothetical protein